MNSSAEINNPVILLYDLETTGFNSFRNGITQLSACAIRLTDDLKIHPIKAVDFKICPRDGKEIVADALKIQGITDLETGRLPDSEAFKRFVHFLEGFVDKFDKKDKITLCGFGNIRFCTPFLRQWFIDNCDDYYGSWFWPEEIDLKVEAAKSCIFQRPYVKNLTLGQVADFYKIPVNEESLHDSKYDLSIICKLFQKICLGNNQFLPPA